MIVFMTLNQGRTQAYGHLGHGPGRSPKKIYIYSSDLGQKNNPSSLFSAFLYQNQPPAARSTRAEGAAQPRRGQTPMSPGRQVPRS